MTNLDQRLHNYGAYIESKRRKNQDRKTWLKQVQVHFRQYRLINRILNTVGISVIVAIVAYFPVRMALTNY